MISQRMPLPGKRSIAILLASLMFLLSVGPELALAASLLYPEDTARSEQQQQEQQKLTIGVLDLDFNNVDEGEARAITERLRIWLSRTGAFEVIERNKMESIMSEVGFQFSGACNTNECVIQVGQILGASKMVAGSVSKVGNLYSLQVRIVDIATSRIEYQSFKDESGGIDKVLTDATQTVANELAENVTGRAVPTQPAQPQQDPEQQQQQQEEVTPPGGEEQQPAETERQRQPRERKGLWWLWILIIGGAAGGAMALSGGEGPGAEGPGQISGPPARPIPPM